MADKRQGRPIENRRQTTERRSSYVHGNAAKELDVRIAIKEEPRKKLSHTARKNREKAFQMNLGYVIFLAAALCAAGFVLIGYIKLQSSITSSVKHISSLESQLNDLKLANDENYNRVLASVDLEEIKRIAMNELGMKYAQEGQVVIVAGEESDYVRQYKELPQ